MKKAIRILVTAHVLLCTASSAIYTLMYIAIIGSLIFGGSVNEDFVIPALMALPLVVDYYLLLWKAPELNKKLNREPKD